MWFKLCWSLWKLIFIIHITITRISPHYVEIFQLRSTFSAVRIEVLLKGIGRNKEWSAVTREKDVVALIVWSVPWSACCVMCWVWPGSTVLRMEDADWLDLATSPPLSSTTSVSHSGWLVPGPQAPGLSAEVTNKIVFNSLPPCQREVLRWAVGRSIQSIRWEVINLVMTDFDN